MMLWAAVVLRRVGLYNLRRRNRDSCTFWGNTGSKKPQIPSGPTLDTFCRRLYHIIELL